MNKKLRKQVYDKFQGRCAYSGQPLDDKWQVDHATSKRKNFYNACYNYGDAEKFKERLDSVNKFENLLPACRIINHYKRELDVEGFRKYLADFHIRLAKLPKNPKVQRSMRRKKYMQEVADIMAITPDKPFSGKFYFETLNH